MKKNTYDSNPITVRIKGKDEERVDDLARKHKVSRSEIVRTMVEMTTNETFEWYWKKNKANL